MNGSSEFLPLYVVGKHNQANRTFKNHPSNALKTIKSGSVYCHG